MVRVQNASNTAQYSDLLKAFQCPRIPKKRLSPLQKVCNDITCRSKNEGLINIPSHRGLLGSVLAYIRPEFKPQVKHFQ